MHEKGLCKQSVYNAVETPCGKVLWISLWKMWKSYGFPQGNRGFHKLSPVEVVHESLHKPTHNRFVCELRNRKKSATEGKNLPKKVENSYELVFLPLPGGCGGRKFL